MGLRGVGYNKEVTIGIDRGADNGNGHIVYQIGKDDGVSLSKIVGGAFDDKGGLGGLNGLTRTRGERQ